MLYIKNYGSLNRLVSGAKREPSLIDELLPLKGKALTVRTRSAWFCGILNDVFPEKIVLAVPARGCRPSRRDGAGDRVEIASGQITAVFYPDTSQSGPVLPPK